jgi:hypothetical protein
MLGQPLISHGIARIRRMLTAVDFNDQTPLSAYEVDNVLANWFLTNKLAAFEGTRAQLSPQTQIRHRGITPSSSAICLREMCATHAETPPHPGSARQSANPDLSPQAGRGKDSL